MYATSFFFLLQILHNYVVPWDPWFMKFSPILEQSPRDWERSLHQNVGLTIFHTKYMSPCVENGQNYIAMYHWSPIVGRRSWKVEKYGTNLSHSFPSFLNILPGIWEQPTIKVWFWQFFTHGDIYFVCEKLS